MFQRKDHISTPLDQWPVEWGALCDSFREVSAKHTVDFWKTMVESYVTSVPIEANSESGYQECFQKFWDVYTQKIKDNPAAILEAAKCGYDVYIQNNFTGIAEAELSEILQKKWPNKDTALHLATRGGHTCTVGVLLSMGAKPNAVGSYGETALHAAAYCDNAEIAKLLLDSEGKASCGIKRMDSQKPINIAAQQGSINVIEALVAHDKKQLKVCGREGRTAFYQAALSGRSGNLALMEKLLELGDDIDQINLYSRGPVLHMAAIKNKPELVEFMLSHGANVDKLDHGGFTPLQRCSMQRNPSLEAARLLIASGANVNAGGDKTPMNLLAQNSSGKRADDLQALLIKSGAVTTSDDSLVASKRK